MSRGVDWSTQPNLPTQGETRTAGPFLYHSIFLFDLKENLEVLWGEDVKELLPKPPEPRELSSQALDYYLLSRLTTLRDDGEGRQRAAWAAYKATLVAQLHFGERTLSKWRILELFLKNVPEFPLKHVGEHVIRSYLGASYPERPPVYEELGYYVNYVKQLRSLFV